MNGTQSLQPTCRLALALRSVPDSSMLQSAALPPGSMPTAALYQFPTCTGGPSCCCSSESPRACSSSSLQGRCGTRAARLQCHLQMRQGLQKEPTTELWGCKRCVRGAPACCLPGTAERTQRRRQRCTPAGHTGQQNLRPSGQIVVPCAVGWFWPPVLDGSGPKSVRIAK